MYRILLNYTLNLLLLLSSLNSPDGDNVSKSTANSGDNTTNWAWDQVTDATDDVADEASAIVAVAEVISVIVIIVVVVWATWWWWAVGCTWWWWSVVGAWWCWAVVLRSRNSDSREGKSNE